jgi:hypothetical protein
MKKAIPLLVAAVVAAFVVAYSMYNKPHRDYASEEVAKSWSSTELVEWHTSHPDSEHVQWQDLVMQVSGNVMSVSDRGIVLSPGVVVIWEEGQQPASAPEGAVTIQGRLVGFDDLFGEVRIDHARVVNGAD